MDKAETRRLLVDHYLDFYELALGMLRDDEDARDAVQEALVRTMSRPLLRNPLSYCFQTVRHVAIDTIRHRARTVRLADHQLPVDEPTTDADMLEEVIRLRNELPRVMKTIVVLHDQKGYTYDDIAALTGLSKMTVRRRLREAHESIRKQMEKQL